MWPLTQLQVAQVCSSLPTLYLTTLANRLHHISINPATVSTLIAFQSESRLPIIMLSLKEWYLSSHSSPFKLNMFAKLFAIVLLVSGFVAAAPALAQRECTAGAYRCDYILTNIEVCDV